MEQHTFNWDGKAITVQIDKATGHKFKYPENGNTIERQIKGFANSFTGNQIKVDWVESIKDQSGNVIASKSLDYTEADQIRYDQLYNAQSFVEPSGDYYAKQCVNGVMFRAIGCKCFDATGIFVDPNL